MESLGWSMVQVARVPDGAVWRCLRWRDLSVVLDRVRAEQRGGLLGAVTWRLQLCRFLLLLPLLLMRLCLLLLRLCLLLRLHLGPDLLPFLLRRDRSHLCPNIYILEALVLGLCALCLCALIYHLRLRICKRICLRLRRRSSLHLECLRGHG